LFWGVVRREFGRGSLNSPTSGPGLRTKVSRIKIAGFKSVFVFFFLATVAAASVDSRPVNTTEIAAWLVGGVSSSRLARLVKERGLATLPTQAELRQLKAAGAKPELLQILSSGNLQSAKIGPPIPENLLQAAVETEQERLHDAELHLHDTVSAD